MNIFPKRNNGEPPIDFEQLEKDVTEHLTGAPRQQPSKFLPLQVIGHAITRLTWKEAEAMGEAIQAKIAEGKNGSDITKAIQAWAAGWEAFTNE